MTSSETAAFAADFLARVPMARTLGLRIELAAAQRAVVALPDREDLHNHLGGPHAGAVFSLAETASGVIIFVAFGAYLQRAVPLAVGAQIHYRKLAMGELTATAELSRPVGEIVAELDAGGRPEFDVPVDITRVNGDVTAQMTVRWTLRPTS